MAAPHVLIADDQEDILETLQLTLKNEGWASTAVKDPQAVLNALSERQFDLLLMDLNYQRDTTSGQEGLDLLKAIGDLEGQPPIVVMTAWASIELAVEALHLGAKDFVEKPWSNLRLLNVLRAQIDLNTSQRQQKRLTHAMLSGAGSSRFIAESAALKDVLQTMASVAASDASVLIVGENGTGKNQLAAMLHQQSSRRDQAFVTMDMGAITESLFESELFGHVRGAFTDAKDTKIGRLELAEGGTLFLDEIANISAPQQSRLLRVLETGEYETVGSSQTRQADIRFISATNADINQMIEDREFRRDLFYRLNTVVLDVPPLRDRKEDIAPLVQHYLNQLSARYRKTAIQLSDEAMQLMLRYEWPGNVRELAHAIERALLVCQTDKIQPPHLGLEQSDAAPASQIHALLSIEEAEKQLIERTLAHHQFNVSQSATSLGISRSSLYRKMEAYGLSDENLSDE